MRDSSPKAQSHNVAKTASKHPKSVYSVNVICFQTGEYIHDSGFWKPKTVYRFSAMASNTEQPNNNALFDVFYEELLTQLVESGELQEKIPQEFMQLQSDLQRVEYLMQLRPLVREFRIKSKQNLKSLEKSTKFREEGNKLFQNEQTAQAIIVYNKSLSCAPHPTVEEYLHPEIENEKHTSVRGHLLMENFGKPSNFLSGYGQGWRKRDH